MSTTTTAPNPCKVITGVVRLSYAHLLEAVAIEEGQEKKFSVSLIIPKDDKRTISLIEKAINAAKEQGKSKWGGKIPAKLKLPLRDGDEERPEDDAYANSYFINASCKTKPGIVDTNLQPIIEADQIYSGMYARASVNFYPFDVSGNKGIACGLNNIQKVKDGESLGGRSRAEDDFADSLDNDDLM
jgi:hypothetical protein